MSVKAGQAQAPPGQALRSGALIGQGRTAAETRSALQKSPQFQGNPDLSLVSWRTCVADLLADHTLHTPYQTSMCGGPCVISGTESAGGRQRGSPIRTALAMFVSEQGVADFRPRWFRAWLTSPSRGVGPFQGQPVRRLGGVGRGRGGCGCRRGWWR